MFIKKYTKTAYKYYNFDYKKTSVVYQCVPNLKTTLSIEDKKKKYFYMLVAD